MPPPRERLAAEATWPEHPATATTTTEPEKVLTSATRAGYAADWALFTDWCTAADLDPLPAPPGTVTAFLAENPAAAATHARRVSSIAHVHRRFGYPSPTGQPHVTRWLRTAADLPAEPEPAVPTGRIDQLLRQIPTTGWPAGLFGRRDRLLLLLRYRAALTLAELSTLTTEHLAADPQQLTVAVGARQIRLPATDDPASCPGCAWILWRRMLHLIGHHIPAARLADTLRGAAPLTTSHRCATPKTRTFRDEVPVFLPLDRWGAATVPPAPISGRSITTLTSQHLAGWAPRHPDPHPVVDDTDPAAAPTPSAGPAGVVDPTSAADRYLHGLAARRRDVGDLVHVRDVLDDVDRAAAALDARIRDLSTRYGL